MSDLVVKVKRVHPDAVLPAQAHFTDAAYDLAAVEDARIVDDPDDRGTFLEYRTGLQLEPPPGYHFVIHPRSSISKYDLMLCNSVGLVDGGYRGEVLCRFKVVPRFKCDSLGGLLLGALCTLFFPRIYKKGDAIAQLMLEHDTHATFIEVDKLGGSDRGAGGFGHSGAKGGTAKGKVND